MAEWTFTYNKSSLLCFELHQWKQCTQSYREDAHMCWCIDPDLNSPCGEPLKVSHLGNIKYSQNIPFLLLILIIFFTTTIASS